MTASDDEDDFSRWARVKNRSHGYGGGFNHENHNDKSIVETSTANEWGRAVSIDFGLSVSDADENPDDPPDCHIEVEGKRLSIELMHLIDQGHKHRASKEESPYHGKLFEDMQWSPERLEVELNVRIQSKGSKYKRRGILIDVLVIHSAEIWLYSNQVSEWLKDMKLQEHPSILNAFLLFEYEPGRGVEHWPVFQLYGDLIRTSKHS